jgi:hypothetical protein
LFAHTEQDEHNHDEHLQVQLSLLKLLDAISGTISVSTSVLLHELNKNIPRIIKIIFFFFNKI